MHDPGLVEANSKDEGEISVLGKSVRGCYHLHVLCRTVVKYVPVALRLQPLWLDVKRYGQSCRPARSKSDRRERFRTLLRDMRRCCECWFLVDAIEMQS